MNNKDFKWTEKRFGLTFANILKKLGGLSKNDTDGSIEYKDEQGNVSKLVTDSNFSSLLAKNGLIEVKWQELKDKRDNGELIPGSLYRITDYQCTTTQENTQSAGHQFDIVLLALSEDKLAEEGWAMEHPTDVYDVTFADGVTKKCYIAPSADGEDMYNIVDCETLLGYTDTTATELTINEEDKTAIADYNSTLLDEEDVPYNYFQNSNLSAWKVWYSLDNDTARFAWADDSVDESVTAKITTISGGLEQPFDYIGTEVVDGVTYYRWFLVGILATLSPTPSVGDDLYQNRGHGWELYDYKVLSFTPGHEGKYVPSEINVGRPSIDEGETEITIFKRDSERDTDMKGTMYYSWRDSSSRYFTRKEVPSAGDALYVYRSRRMVEDEEATIISFTPGVDAENGRGVIYRLIDEFNNDVAYDFKNIQFLVKIDMETGYYDRGGDDTYVYSLNAWIDAVIMDASIIGNTLQNDVGIIDMVANNVIKTMPPIDADAKGWYLPFNVVLTSNEDGEGYYGANDINFDNYSNHNIVTSPCRAMHFDGICSENVIPPSTYVTFINCANMTEQNSYSGLYLNNKKVLTES